MNRPCLALLASLCALTSVPSAAHSTSIPVPTTYAQVQAAITAASPGDFIVIVSGTTYQPFVLSKAVEVRNNAGHEIIIDGTAGTYAARITHTGGRIAGLTLKGGSTYSLEMSNDCETDSCKIIDNGTAYSLGAVSFVGGGYAHLKHSTIELTSGHGEAIDIASGAVHTLVSDNVLTISDATAGDYEAIKVGDDDVTLDNNTITYSTQEHLGWGISLAANTGPGTITDNTITGAAIGIFLNAASSCTVQRNIIAQSTIGLEQLSSSSNILENNTFYRASCGSNTAGIYFASTNGTSTVSNNLFYNLITGIYVATSSGTDTYSHNIYWGGASPCGSSNNISLGSTEITAKEPLFCETHDSSVEQYTQRMDSEAAPGNNGWNELVGAKDVECSWGTIARTTVVPSGTTVKVLETVTVPAGKVLTVGYANLLATAGDNIQLLVSGSLVGNRANFASVEGSPGSNDWDGIVIKNGASGSLNSVTGNNTFVRDAEFGVEARESGHLYVEGLTVTHGGYGIRGRNQSGVRLSHLTLSSIQNGVSLADTAKASILNSTITTTLDGINAAGKATVDTLTGTTVSVTSGGDAVDFNAGSGSVDNCTLSGKGTDNAGVRIRGTGAAVSVVDCILACASGGSGLWASGTHSVSMPTGTVSGAGYGVWADDHIALTLGKHDNGDSAQVTISSCTYNGVGITSDGACTVEEVSIVGSSTTDWVGIDLLPGSDATLIRTTVASASGSSAIGILVESDADVQAPNVHNITSGQGITVAAESTATVSIGMAPTYSPFWRNPISKNCTFGIMNSGVSHPMIRDAVVHDHAYGVYISPAGIPNLGDGGSNGSNSIYTCSNRLAGGSSRFTGYDPVPAMFNWWGSNPPNGAKISSWVDYTNYLTSNPNPILSLNEGIAVVPVETGSMVSRPTYPSPFSSNVSIPYRVGGAGQAVNVSVYDVSGRLVKTIVSSHVSGGEYVASWDGTRTDGQAAARGIYFAVVRVGELRASHKLALVR